MPLEELTSDPKTSVRFRYQNQKKIKELLKKTHFNQDELDAIVMIYFNLKNEFGPKDKYVTAPQLQSVIYKCFYMPEKDLISEMLSALDKTIKTSVTLEAWVRTFSLFLRGTLDEKIDFCFAAYDIVGDGVIERDQMLALAKNFIVKSPDEDDEGVKDYVNIIIKKMDLDLDGAISFNDYRESIKKEPLLLECFGQVLPDRASVYAFLATFTPNLYRF